MTILRAGTATDVGRVRSNNQDSHLVLGATSLYGVADGMGGHQGGEVASAIAVELTGKHATEPTLDSLMAAVRIANRAIFEKAGSDRDLHGMGTTLVAIQLVTSSSAASVGSARRRRAEVIWSSETSLNRPSLQSRNRSPVNGKTVAPSTATSRSMPRARVRMLRCGWTAASSGVSWPSRTRSSTRLWSWLS